MCLIKSSLLKKFNARMEKPIYKPKWRYQLCYHIRTSQMHWEVETGFPDPNHHVGMKSVVNIFILLLYQDHSNIFHGTGTAQKNGYLTVRLTIRVDPPSHTIRFHDFA